MTKKFPLFFFVLFLTFLGEARLQVEITSESALLINAKTGKVLFAKNASKPMYPASCTKIPFALYAIKYHQGLFNKTLTASNNALKTVTEAQKSKNNFSSIPSYILETDASHMGIKVGEEMTFYELLEGTVVVSGDDASNMIAEAMGNGSIEKCVEDVNIFLAKIGCKNTHFTNPHGLHHPDHVTTAEDLALICREAMKEPLFAKMAKMTSYARPQTNKQEPVVLRQTNRLLTKSSPFYYTPAVGIKTGYHRRAGYCLAAQAEKDGRSLISVVLHANSSDERFQDTKSLFEAAFQEELVTRELLRAGPQTFSKTMKGGKSPLQTESKDSLHFSYYPAEEPAARCQLTWNEISLPIKKGSVVGELQLILDGELKKKTPLYASNNVELTLSATLLKHWLLILFSTVGCIILFLFFKGRKRSRLTNFK